MTAPAPFRELLWPAGLLPDVGPREISFVGLSQAGTPFGQVRNVRLPRFTVYLPDPTIATGTAVVVCPGGGYHVLAIDHEGHDVARWLNAKGIAAVVLEYRLIPTQRTRKNTQRHFRPSCRIQPGCVDWQPNTIHSCGLMSSRQSDARGKWQRRGEFAATASA